MDLPNKPGNPAFSLKKHYQQLMAIQDPAELYRAACELVGQHAGGKGMSEKGHEGFKRTMDTIMAKFRAFPPRRLIQEIQKYLTNFILKAGGEGVIEGIVWGEITEDKIGAISSIIGVDYLDNYSRIMVETAREHGIYIKVMDEAAVEKRRQSIKEARQIVVKPRIIVISEDTDNDFKWMSDGWNTMTDSHTSKAKRLFVEADAAINAAKNAPDAVSRLQAAGFEVVRETQQPADVVNEAIEPPQPVNQAGLAEAIVRVLSSHARQDLSANEIAAELSVQPGLVRPILKQLEAAGKVWLGYNRDQLTYILNPAANTRDTNYYDQERAYLQRSDSY